MKKWRFPVPLDAPCKDCVKKPCGAFHDQCPEYAEFKKKNDELKEAGITSKVEHESKVRFWRDVRNNGIKIGNRGGDQQK